MTHFWMYIHLKSDDFENALLLLSSGKGKTGHAFPKEVWYLIQIVIKSIGLRLKWLINHKALVLLTTRSWESHPGWLIRPRCSSQKYHYDFVSVIASLGVQSRFWLIPFIALSEEVMARSESTWLGILTPIQVNVPYGFSIQLSKSSRGECSVLFRIRNKCPSTN